MNTARVFVECVVTNSELVITAQASAHRYGTSTGITVRYLPIASSESLAGQVGAYLGQLEEAAKNLVSARKDHIMVNLRTHTLEGLDRLLETQQILFEGMAKDRQVGITAPSLIF